MGNYLVLNPSKQTKWQHKIMKGEVWPEVFLCKKTKTDKVWETIIWYLVQYLCFTSVRTASEATVKCLVKDSTLLKMLLLNHKSALCPAALCINQGLLKCSLSFDMLPHALFSISGVFALLQAYAFLQYLKDRLTRQEFQTLFFLGVSLAAGMVFLTVIYLTYTGMSGLLLPTGKWFLLL